MAEFIFRGTVELSGVYFIVEAETLEEARKKASAGEYEDYDTDGAETANWTINPLTGKPND